MHRLHFVTSPHLCDIIIWQLYPIHSYRIGLYVGILIVYLLERKQSEREREREMEAVGGGGGGKTPFAKKKKNDSQDHSAEELQVILFFF